MKTDKLALVNFIGDRSVPDHKWMLQSSIGRTGSIFSHISIMLLLFGFTLAIATIVSWIVTLMCAVVMLIIIMLMIIFTFGLILLADSKEFNQLLSFNETLGKVTMWLSEVSVKIAPYVLVASIVFAIMSVVCMLFDKTRRHTARYILSGVTIVFAIAIIVITLVG